MELVFLVPFMTPVALVGRVHFFVKSRCWRWRETSLNVEISQNKRPTYSLTYIQSTCDLLGYRPTWIQYDIALLKNGRKPRWWLLSYFEHGGSIILVLSSSSAFLRPSERWSASFLPPWTPHVDSSTFWIVEVLGSETEDSSATADEDDDEEEDDDDAGEGEVVGAIVERGAPLLAPSSLVAGALPPALTNPTGIAGGSVKRWGCG